MTLVYLGLGSNLGDKESQLRDALTLLSEKVGTIISSSPLYETEPWRFESKDTFLNMAIAIETDLSPMELLIACKEIEKQLGRKKGVKKEYQSRTIDIDVLFYEDKIIQNDSIKIPHLHIEKRLFVLLPMNDIAPEFQHPVLKETISELAKRCIDTSWIRKIDIISFNSISI